MLNREHELKLQEHEEALENLEEVKETSVQLDKELKRQQVKIGKSKAVKQTKNTVRDNLIEDR